MLQRKCFSERIKKVNWLYYILTIPGIVYLLLFRYLPMAGLYIVFERYTYQGGLFGSEFVGLQNFEFFFPQHEDRAAGAAQYARDQLWFYFPEYGDQCRACHCRK